MYQRVDVCKMFGKIFYAFLNRNQIIVILIWIERVYTYGLKTILNETMARAKDY